MTTQSLTQFQSDRLVAMLPRLSPQQQQMMKMVSKWESAPVGLGEPEHGPIVGAVSDAPLWKIYLDPNLYVYGKNDVWAQYPETLHNLALALDRMIVRDGNHFPLRTLPEPLLVAQRDNPDPAMLGQDMVLIRKLLPLRAAEELHLETVPVVNLGRLSDYDIINVGLWCRMTDSEATSDTIFKTLWALEAAYAEHRCAPDSPKPPSQVGLAELLGCDRSYISKLESLWRASKQGVQYVAEGRLAVRVAFEAVAKLITAPQTLDATLTYLADHHIGGEEATHYIERQAHPATPRKSPTIRLEPDQTVSYPAPVAREVPPSIPSPPTTMPGSPQTAKHEAATTVADLLAEAWDLIESDPADLRAVLGDDSFPTFRKQLEGLHRQIDQALRLTDEDRFS